MAGRGNTPLNRQNEYFVPRDGIDREVITADICRYLGNDALVRPGTYENKETGQLIQGYYINAYRNLTTAMIDDLKEASRQWQLERTRAQSGGAYRHSETHHRQQAASAVNAVDPAYGNPTPPAQYYSGPGQPQYSQPVANSYASQGYANAPQGNYGYQTSGNTYSPPPNQPSRYPPPQAMPQSYTPAEQPYLAGSNLGAAPQYAEFPREQPPRLPSGGPARVYASAPQQQPGYPAPAPAAGGFYSQPQQGQPMYAPVQVQPQDPFYGRGGGAGQYDDSASPTTQAQSDRVAGQANQNYSPEPAFEDNPSRTMPPSAAPAVAPVHNHKPDERHHHHHQPRHR